MTIYMIVSISALVAIGIPLVFVITRNSTKFQRQGIVRDLSAVFGQAGLQAKAVIPSFEFVKYKYYLNDDQDQSSRRDFALVHWIVSALPLALYLFVLNVLCIGMVVHVAFRTSLPVEVAWLARDPLPLFAWVILASYTGALLFTVRAFNQAINNFDLSPLSFVGATVNLLVGLVSALLLVFGVMRLAVDVHWDLTTPSVFPALLIGAFAAGYFPDVAVRNITRISQLKYYKREDARIFKNFLATPVEIIDGIDLEIRARLADYHISTVQNLAAANPLMLFVETPYGVYQIMDWVAQAQLCCSVGPSALLQLWGIGVRTIFDLERVALDPACHAPELIIEIGSIIGQKQTLDQTGRLVYPSKEAIAADIRFRLENLHVHRLRQIFNQVGESLGLEARRLPPVLNCPPAVGDSCPFARYDGPQQKAAA